MIIPSEYDSGDIHSPFNMYAYEDVGHVYYEETENLFYFDGGYLNHNIHGIMTPIEVYLFKLYKRDMFICTDMGDIYEIHYDSLNDYESDGDCERS